MRPERFDLPDIPCHIYARGNNRQNIFHDDEDRQTYLSILRFLHKKIPFDLYSFVLMDNHYHLLLTMRKDAKRAALMHRLQLTYSTYYRRKYSMVGHLFQGRYGVQLVDADNYFLTVDRYIHLNPVRAGMIARAEDYQWSSYRLRLAGVEGDWLSHREVLDYFSNNRDRAVAMYQDFTASAAQRKEEWSDDLLAKMNVIGSYEFTRRIQRQTGLDAASPDALRF